MRAPLTLEGGAGRVAWNVRVWNFKFEISDPRYGSSTSLNHIRKIAPIFFASSALADRMVRASRAIVQTPRALAT